MMSAFNKYGLLLIILLSLIAFYPGLNNEFTHLDDQVQVVENNSIQAIHWTNIKAIFSSTTVGMYQPLSSLLFAFTYQINGADAFYFHLISLLLHLINIVLVYSLLQKLKFERTKALLLTALFALHPMQVESVSWISAFSNLTFSCFYLLSIIQYRDFQLHKSGKGYSLAMLFFILSLLSKSTAVTLPLVLLAMDYFDKQKILLKDWLNKLPYFALSIGFGLITIFSRESAGHLSDLSAQFEWFDRIFLISYSVFFYPIKWLFPFELSAFYPYPELSNGFLPWIFYVSAIALVLAFGLIWRHRKRSYLLFGTLFYLFSISVVLQIIPVGNQLTTDRYIYLPMLGLLIIVYELIQPINVKKLLPFFAIWALLLLLASHQRAKVWANDQLIWEDVIDKHPKVAQAYNNLGSYLLLKGQFQMAFTHFNKAVQLKPYYADALSNRGNLYSQQGKSHQALNDFNQAIKLRPHADAYFNRANEYVRLGELQKAIEDYQASTELNASPDTYTNWAYAYLQLKQTRKAKNKLQKALQLDPQFAQAHFLSGILAQQQNDTNKACAHFQKAAQQNHPQAKQAFGRFCQ